MILLLVFIRSETQYLSRYCYLPTVDVCRYLVQYYILYSLYFMVRVAANLFVLLIDNFLFKLGLLTADMAKTMDTICTFAEILSFTLRLFSNSGMCVYVLTVQYVQYLARIQRPAYGLLARVLLCYSHLVWSCMHLYVLYIQYRYVVYTPLRRFRIGRASTPRASADLLPAFCFLHNILFLSSN